MTRSFNGSNEDRGLHRKYIVTSSERRFKIEVQFWVQALNWYTFGKEINYCCSIAFVHWTINSVKTVNIRSTRAMVYGVGSDWTGFTPLEYDFELSH
uniref:Uncharacterized protein n=1 Tax=Vespula pensylvanica TaxID=30213 RepID=A0A834PE79_VESPE|nr:hypothetical protein H0235_000448 [Vespula pensylvanica]